MKVFCFCFNCEDTWDIYGTKSEVLNGYLPVMTAPGNHEESYKFTSFINRFSHVIGDNSGSKTPLYFSYNYGFSHIITISSEHDFLPLSHQYEWLEKDLKAVDRSKTPFIFVQFHKPMYTSNTAHKADLELREEIEHFFKKYKVLMVFTGHVHAYERTCEIYGAKCVRKEPDRSKYHYKGEGSIHNYVGTMGRSLATNYEKQPDWSYNRFAKYGYSELEVSIDPKPFVSVKFYEVHDVGSETLADDFTIEFDSCNGKYSYELDYNCESWKLFSFITFSNILIVLLCGLLCSLGICSAICMLVYKRKKSSYRQIPVVEIFPDVELVNVEIINKTVEK